MSKCCLKSPAGVFSQLLKVFNFSTVLHNFCHAQAASAVWASPTIEGDPRRALQALGMTDTDRLLEKSVFFSSLPLIIPPFLCPRIPSVLSFNSHPQNTGPKKKQTRGELRKSTPLKLAILRSQSQRYLRLYNCTYILHEGCEEKYPGVLYE